MMDTKYFKVFVVLYVFIMIPVSVKAQKHESYDTIYISYKEQLPLYNGDMYNWELIDMSNDKILHSDKQGDVEYTFKRPGLYYINYTESELHKKQHENSMFTCRHYPNDIFIKVLPSAMTFDFSTLQLGDKFKLGEVIKDKEIQIKVKIEHFDNKEIEFIHPIIKSSGIGVNITGELINKQKKYLPGEYLLLYKLNGNITNTNYFMLDFYDVNNHIQSYSIPYEIKN